MHIVFQFGKIAPEKPFAAFAKYSPGLLMLVPLPIFSVVNAVLAGTALKSHMTRPMG